MSAAAAKKESARAGKQAAREVLAKSEEKYRSILESIEDSYFELDIKGNFTFFNNILSGIIGYTQLIKKHSSKETKIQPYVNQVIKASERATGRIKQILLFSRKTESEKIPADIVLIAKEALKLVRASIPPPLTSSIISMTI